MSDNPVTAHYAQSNLLAAFEAAIAEIGKTTNTVTTADLAPADEFHIGGRPATEHLLDQLDLQPTANVLDVGCGVGGPARTAATRFERITGIDLTPTYVETGNAINRWLGFDGRIDLRVGSALDLEFDDGSFDGGYMIHVGMNIEDKHRLLTEVARVLRRGARFGIYDVMRSAEGALEFPVPWAADQPTSHVVSPDHYRQAAEAAGLGVIVETSRLDQAKAAFAQVAQQTAPSPLGLHLVMGPTIGTKVKNMVANVNNGLITPVELILERPA